MRTISAVLHSAITLYYQTGNKWHTPTEVNQLLYAVSEMTGICSGILEIAVCEKIANKMAKDLRDICSQRLRENNTGQRHYTTKATSDRFGGVSTTAEPIYLAQPICDLVDQWIDTLERGAYLNNGLTISSPFEAKRDEFARLMARTLPTLKAHYSEQFVQSLERVCEHSLNGGAA